MNIKAKRKTRVTKQYLLHQVLKRTKTYQIVGGFVIFVLLVSIAFWLLDPNVPSYGEALWYSYVNLFTIGFGDIVPSNVICRILSVILTIYATLVIALVTGVIVTYHNELAKWEYQNSRALLLAKMEDLPNLSKHELAELSEKVKKITR